MYDQFRWTNVSARRNRLTMEYEPLQPFFFVALAAEAGCGTMLDVGANVGAYSLFGSLIPGIERVVAFEPNPDAIREIQANIALNSLARVVEVQGKAVSSSPGTVSFGVISKYSGANSVVGTSIHEPSSFHKQVEVEAITLDQFMPSPDERPLSIKIDVEGHEAEVIRGARRLLAGNQTVIQLEGYGQRDDTNVRSLEELGYFRLTGIGPDYYLSNIEAFRDPAAVVRVYERAAREMIDYNHRNKSVLLKRGDFGLELSGRSAGIARGLAKRLIGRHL